MIRVITGSRLHFGLFHLPGDGSERWPDQHGVPALSARRYGGVGMMIDAPGIQLSASRADSWSAEGPLAERALAFARRIAASSPGLTSPCQINVMSGAAEHMGLGTGTQLGLAVARALAAAAGRANQDVALLARRVGRGERSALGTHGFAHGGFLVEAGQGTADDLAPLVARAAFPEAWRILLVMPPWGLGLHGGREREAFAQLATPELAWTDALCRLVLLGMLPALIEQDFESFGAAVHEFNARVGEAFASVQGGAYADARIADVVHFIRSQGVPGVGQSSWGPAIFAFVADEERGDDLARRVLQEFNLQVGEVILTRARNRGAEVR